MKILQGEKPDASEVAYTMQAISESDEGIAHWIEGLLNFGAVSDRIDVVSAHRVVFGEWHSEYEQFEEDSSAYIGRISPELTALNFGNQVVDPYWLKEYISDCLHQKIIHLNLFDSHTLLVVIILPM